MTARVALKPGGASFVKNDIFTYRTKKGDLIELSLDLPPEIMKKADAESGGNPSEEQQFDAVLAWAGEDLQAAFDGMGILERARFLAAFFGAFQEAAGLPLGESLSSSRSSRSTAQR